MYRKILAVFCVFTLAAGCILAQENNAASVGVSTDNKTVFQEAQLAFDEAGKLEESSPQNSRELYLKAYRRFDVLAKQNTGNAAVYYNLGNTCYRLGRIGEAILNYQRALLLRPHDENIIHNLEIARAQRKDNIQEEEETRILKALLFWHFDLSRTTRLQIFGFCFVIFWMAMIVRSLINRKTCIPKWGLTILAVLWVSLLGSLVIQPFMEAAEMSGVVTAQQVVAREGNGDNYKPCFKTPLHEGTEFKVFEKRSGWYGVTLYDGRSCWIPQSSCGLIGAE